MNYIDFQPNYHSWANPYLVVLYSLSYIFLHLVCVCVHKRYWSVIFFLCCVFECRYGDFIEQTRNYSLLYFERAIKIAGVSSLSD